MVLARIWKGYAYYATNSSSWPCKCAYHTCTKKMLMALYMDMPKKYAGIGWHKCDMEKDVLIHFCPRCISQWLVFKGFQYKKDQVLNIIRTTSSTSNMVCGCAQDGHTIFGLNLPRILGLINVNSRTRGVHACELEPKHFMVCLWKKKTYSIFFIQNLSFL